MSGWRKCDRCRKVRTAAEFDGAAPTCQVCRTAAAAPARKRAATVTRIQAPAAPAAPPAAAGPRRPRLGAVGSGDLEVRERRARRVAQDALAEAHPEEFATLLREARQAEGLRPLSTGAAPPPPGTED